MSVLSWRELPRTATHRFGESPQYQRRFILTLGDPGAFTSSMGLSAVGVFHTAPHPEQSGATCNNIEVNEAYEGSRYHVEIIADYEVTNITQGAKNPLQRPDVFSFQSAGQPVPALFYFDDDEQKPLTNAAGDYFEGLTVDEATQKLTIKANRAQFPSAIAASLTNCVNDAAYLGFPADSWKCQGIAGERTSEVVDGVEVFYWAITVELLARQTSWNLLIPNVGYNYIEGGVKKRAYVIDPEDGSSKLATANPVALNVNGSIKTNGDPPPILNRRVYRRVDFSSYFSTPPA